MRQRTICEAEILIQSDLDFYRRSSHSHLNWINFGFGSASQEPIERKHQSNIEFNPGKFMTFDNFIIQRIFLISAYLPVRPVRDCM